MYILLALVLTRQVVQSALHSLLPGDLRTFLRWHGFGYGKKVAWELFAGSHRWSSALAEIDGWAVLRPMDILLDRRADLNAGLGLPSRGLGVV